MTLKSNAEELAFIAQEIGAELALEAPAPVGERQRRVVEELRRSMSWTAQ